MKNWLGFGGAQFTFHTGVVKFLLFLSFVLKILVSNPMPCEWQEELLGIPNWIFMFLQMFSVPSHALEAMQMSPKWGECLLYHLLCGMINMHPT